MSDRTANIVGGMSGLASIVLAVVGFGVLGGTVPKLGASADAVTKYVARSNVETWTGEYLGLLGLLFYIVFAARLWAILRDAEGGTAWLSATALGASLVWVAVLMSGDFLSGAAAFYAGRRGLDPTTTGALYDVKHFAELASGAAYAVFLAAVAAVVLWRRVLPVWLGWAAVVVAVATLVTVPAGPGDTSELPHFAAAVWLVAVSVVMVLRARELGPRPA